MSNKKYIGITIGPIFKTFELAEKTREFWGASYLFSWLCKNILAKILDENREQRIKPEQILLPFSDGYQEEGKGIGIYPDRIILEEKGEQQYDYVVAAILEAKKQLKDEIYTSIQKYERYDPYAKILKAPVISEGNEERKKQLEDFLFRYFQVYSLEVSEKELQLKNDGKTLGLIKNINFYLDHLELRSAITGFDPNPIKVFLRGINFSFLTKEAFNKNFDHFPSLPEIATTELRFIQDENGDYPFRKGIEELCYESLQKAKKREQINTESKKEDYNNKELTDIKPDSAEREDDDLLRNIFQLPGISKHLRTYHRYVAIIHADGDRMGQIIGPLEAAKVSGFSKDLMAFAKEANQVIAGKHFWQGKSDDWGYGGAPIYIGGDDLVFFAPVVSRQALDGKVQLRTIFHLIRELDQVFESIFNQKTGDRYEKYADTKKRPCISYGISITYIKFPLQEAYQNSRKLLEQVKTEEFATRNRLNFNVQKHSGQCFGCIIDKNNKEVFDSILSLLEEHGDKGDGPQGKECDVFVNSVITKLKHYEEIVKACLVQARVEKKRKASSGNTDGCSGARRIYGIKEGCEALFANIFNESIHDKYRIYLNKICDLLITLLLPLESQEAKEKEFTEIINVLYAILRFVHFIRSDEFRN